MSKRAGDIYLLDTLLDDIGVDAARWFFASRGANLDMDIDVDLARRQTSENPVYYVQYAHARIASILRKAADAGLTPAASVAGHLAGPPEAALARASVRFPEIVEDAATSEEDARRHRRNRARNAVPRLLSRRAGRRRGRAGAVGGALALVEAARTTLANALGCSGSSAPDAM
jgi:arginyl-tRNA synthetase